ncbi:DedA family protein [Novosphingobium guangzhouense]|uniref:VTT domain-containing protein n=1 Tax=Novosphingobium guangzhouense TaxID=1850347 RepID=A0A2K2FU12_9SPHN|nr:DedA family protein [Novosphingobium guangzhouense]PNU02254.1 hypothetical protein A8V01_10370 [Novosphingobium guangzhouense]
MEEFISRVTQFVAVHGVWAGPIVGLLSFGESLAVVGLFIPATAVMLAIGGLVGSDVLAPLPIVLWAIGGAVLGDWISFGLGRWIGPSVYHRWPLRAYRPMVARTRLFFRKYGFMAVFLGRFLGPIRATVPLVAGVLDMPRRPFQIANIASAALWVPAMFLPGILATRLAQAGIMVIGTGITELHLFAFGAGIVLITIAAMAIASRLLGGSRRRQRNRSRRVGSAGNPR